MNIPTTILTLLAGVVITLLSLWFGQNNHLLPLAATENAAGIDSLFNAMLAIAVGLFCLVQGLIVIAAVRFRQQPGDESDGPPIHGNIPLEILWTAIPAVLVLGISVYSFEIYNRMGGLDPMDHSAHMKPAQMALQPMAATPVSTQSWDAPALDTRISDASAGESQQPKFAAGVGARPGQEKPADVKVNVMGLQYAWIFTYPETGLVSGELHVPVGQDVELDITAQDVLHAFWVPQFRLKQDAIPGKTTQLRFVPTEPGTYPVVCAELCGSYHGAMRSQVIVHTPEDFDQWQQSQLAALPEAPGADSQAIALASIPTATKTSREFLEPFATALEMDITPEMMAQMHQQHQHHLPQVDMTVAID